MPSLLRPLAACFAAFSLALSAASAESRWEVPFGGNAYLTTAAPGSSDGLRRSGTTRWQDPSTIFSVYFHLDHPADLHLALRFKEPLGDATIQARLGDQRADSAPRTQPSRELPLGQFHVTSPGYVRIDLQGLRRAAADFGEASDLLISTATDNLQLSCVKTNQDNMFYWGRRGPSVHLSYQMPRDQPIEYAYSELTVPEGQDPPGSYFMANGFGEGYFGFQVKNGGERWVLFSVWSPFSTDRPADIPEADRIVLLAKGDGVRVGEFGNEGSGGQSVLVFPWRSGTTYRFLTSVKPDGQGRTLYTSWFSELGQDPWKLVAQFRRPKTDKHLTGFHSFLENFFDTEGYRTRTAHHANPWLRDPAGQWHPITEARLTGDATANGKHRLDYAGGLQGPGFFLRNGGFFSDNTPLNQSFRLTSPPAHPPQIDFAKLPGL